MARAALEVAEIFRDHGPLWREANAGHLSLGQLKVMSAIERCRSAALGGHVLHCDGCNTIQIAYNSCRNRHCPKCQGAAARQWLTARQAELLPVEYFHVVFTVPSEIADIAYHNQAVIYDLMFKAAAETLLTLGADPKHLGARLGLIAVLHTWGSTLTHHPHLHGIVPGGGLSRDGQRWIPCRRGFLLPVKVLSRLFRRRLLENLTDAHRCGQLHFFGQYRQLADARAFANYLRPLRKTDWYLYTKRPFAGPKAVLEYLARYTHRVAISNSRLIAHDDHRVTFNYKDYRSNGRYRIKAMTLDAHEFIRRFLLHTLPKGFHRIRHYGLFANGQRTANLTKARGLLQAPQQPADDAPVDQTPQPPEPVPAATFRCPACGEPMRVIETVLPQHPPRAPPMQRHAA